ncbi:urease accessory protein UreE [Nitratireductor mangrovi]|uniref:Urease accessory protein UreE n=1 Tax=Nitratireductor mangrovi TaxID=2599600 RepID=A0A5B8KXC9_9HYPH|nr:urease accessory protein UreE [Nitratireductor mangrovi]QDZ00148.1 urease accessory protein UreE [Nitratireductor mangrovi]
MLRATTFRRAANVAADPGRPLPFDVAVLAHDERHLRRKAVSLAHGDKVLVDFAEPVALEAHDVLVLEDGRHAEIIAAEEDLFDVRGRDRLHLAELCWHIGNRHLAAQIEDDRIVILRDHVIRTMLEGLGAAVRDISEPFTPLRGAYSGQGHSHAHAHHHDHSDDHEHAHHAGHGHG